MPGHGTVCRFGDVLSGGPRGCRHRSNTSMTIMRPPQQGMIVGSRPVRLVYRHRAARRPPGALGRARGWPCGSHLPAGRNAGCDGSHTAGLSWPSFGVWSVSYRTTGRIFLWRTPGVGANPTRPSQDARRRSRTQASISAKDPTPHTSWPGRNDEEIHLTAPFRRWWCPSGTIFLDSPRRLNLKLD